MVTSNLLAFSVYIPCLSVRLMMVSDQYDLLPGPWQMALNISEGINFKKKRGGREKDGIKGGREGGRRGSPC